ncbi:hypothetical protein DNK44_23505 [Pseudomonas dryadis]|uniref:Uncharacterized protein n=1 Tax=Phytopseudomonas dryadis TaxID=2487520 RepID=A0A4Q9QV00_9GAMM|nr:hypothetical protein DNK44_23505 [Pseudomonas dryadis]
MTDLNGGALFNAEFGIKHRGSTVPERSGVALRFCRRPVFAVRSTVGLLDLTDSRQACSREELGLQPRI